MATHSQKTRDDRPTVLILEHDAPVLRVMLEGINRRCCQADRMVMESNMRPAPCTCQDTKRPCIVVARTLNDLNIIDFSLFDVFICAGVLPDGSGIDVLAIVRDQRPDLPVILTGPPSNASLAIEAIRAGAADYLLTTGGNLQTLPLVIEKCIAQQRIKQENERLHEDLSRSLAETAVKNRQLQTLIQQLETMARTDELTGLCNRRWFNLMLDRSWQEALRNSLPLAFAMMDLDGFKVVNDQRGHQRGDELLRTTGRIIQANSRAVDLPARYGGDEFCILMPNTEVDEAAHVMQRIAQAFQEAMCSLGDDGRMLSISIGISHMTLSRPANADQLVLHADEALYAAKSAGKSCIMIRQSSGILPYEPIKAA